MSIVCFDTRTGPAEPGWGTLPPREVRPKRQKGKRPTWVLMPDLEAAIREMAGRPLTPYPRDCALDAEDHAMKGIINAADALGIDLGARWGNELDVSRA